MTQFIVESLLGLQRRGKRLCMRPLLPPQWEGFELQYRFGASRYDISCRRAEAGAGLSVVCDGIEMDDGRTDDGRTDDGAITLIDDGQVHTVVVSLPRS